MITVLVVDDSPSVREFLVHILSAAPRLRVIGTAGNGEEALAWVRNKAPDVITMDIHMPKMDGFEATRRIMETCPVPIVIVSGSTRIHEVATTFRALEMGALAVVRRPTGIGHTQHEATARELVETVQLMSEVRVVKRWAQSRADTSPAGAKTLKTVGVAPRDVRIELVAVGASTGGPQALQRLLSVLPQDFPAPVVVVQHIAAGFLEGLVEWLAGSCALPVAIARNGEAMRARHIYFAPDGYQMAVGRAGLVGLTREAPVNLHRPSVSYLFRSVVAAYGAGAAGVLLTGMGKDGAEELRLMQQSGAVTIAQDAQSSVVHGMPGEAIRLEAAAYVLEPAAIAALLVRLVAPR
ncbi:MAG: chemotaxis-specific protein-glutamate methyltransferase CheB [Acidiferrobacter sp.]